ncbi:hypothetical protein DEDE109153_12940 [Deinococcus deserti]|uniref:Uncharacterized protein n=1 Tax=Deinococcus deserti (strain DSM 17065 / CIP 109153 / LMG 22923 / VCD115) TaxID=546414 RepID=X5GXX0_DEIDV|nr:hypothetical protein Deide_01074 [Deinococcus deserti VCD115]
MTTVTLVPDRPLVLRDDLNAAGPPEMRAALGHCGANKP